MSPKPPDILRKSHRHTDRKERAVAKEDLREQAAAAAEELTARHPYLGACRCGALGYRFTTATAPAEWDVRACECSFCRDHEATCTSDPEGSVEILVNEPAALERHRFGLETADFLLCGRCGDYVAAVIATPHGARATVNLNLLEDPPRDLPEAVAVSYAAESRGERIRRREERWTPLADKARGGLEPGQ
jgi:hypothetical protein